MELNKTFQTETWNKEVIIVNCNACARINITEYQQQTHKNVSHRCNKHMTKLWHGSSTLNVFHDYIYPCIECDGKDFEAKE